MAKHPPAKRARRANPRQDRNTERSDRNSNVYEFKKGRENTNSEFGMKPKKKVELLPRNIAQEDYIDALEDERNHIIFAMGPAGTGKTMLATQFAIKELLAGRIQKIIIARPAVSVDEQHGFLPGDLQSKLAPWVLPIMDYFKEVYSPASIEKLLHDEILEIAPLAYMRGRTFKNAIILIDESQNATPSQIKMCLTRIGEGSRMIVTGDLNQHDRGFEDNGLKDFVTRLRNTRSDMIALCEFGVGDVERHPVVEEVLRIYDND